MTSSTYSDPILNSNPHGSLGVHVLNNLEDEKYFTMNLESDLQEGAFYTFSCFSTCCHAKYEGQGRFEITKVFGDPLKVGESYLVIRPKY